MTTRAERRADKARTKEALAKQAALRKSGNWLPWNTRSVAFGEVGPGDWTREIHTVHENGVYAVLVRTCETEWGRIEHASIHTLGGGDIPWRDKQRIKDELFGPERVAVEVYPARADLIDQADAYHVWVLPPGFKLPFTIAPTTPDPTTEEEP